MLLKHGGKSLGWHIVITSQHPAILQNWFRLGVMKNPIFSPTEITVGFRSGKWDKPG